MRLLLTSLLGLAAVVATGAAQALCSGPSYDPVKLSDANYKDCSRDGMDCGYWEPATNDPNTKYPLVIFLHGAGASGTGDKTVPVDSGWNCQLEELIANRTTYPAYIMAPRAPSADPGAGRFVNWDWGNSSEAYDVTTLAESSSLTTTRAMLQYLQTQYANIDPDRIYVVGVSMGGYGTWDLISRTPEIFAAGVPAEGGGSPQAAPKLKNMAIWAEHDETDGVSAIGDQLTFAAVAKAGGRPYYTEAISGSHGLGMELSTSMGFVPWMFEQRRGVPSTPVPWLSFSPAGGQVAGPTASVTLNTTPQSDSIYYTLDGSIPNAVNQVGTKYTGPITLNANTVVIAAARQMQSGTEVNVFHAATFTLDGASSGAGGAAAATGGATSGSGGASNSGGAPNPFPPAAGGARAATGGAPASSGSGGAKPSTSGGAASTPAVVRPAGTTKSSGCSLASTTKSGNSAFSFGIASFVLAAFASRRRQRSTRS